MRAREKDEKASLAWTAASARSASWIEQERAKQAKQVLAAVRRENEKYLEREDEIGGRLSEKRAELEAIALELEAAQTERASYLARAKAALPEYAADLVQL